MERVEQTSGDEATDTDEGIVPEDDRGAEPTRMTEQIEQDRAGRDQADG